MDTPRLNAPLMETTATLGDGSNQNGSGTTLPPTDGSNFDVYVTTESNDRQRRHNSNPHFGTCKNIEKQSHCEKIRTKLYSYKLCLILGFNILHLALGVVGGLLGLVLLMNISFFVVCRMKGLTLQERQVRLRLEKNIRKPSLVCSSLYCTKIR